MNCFRIIFKHSIGFLPPSRRITCNTWRKFNLIFMSHPIWDFIPISRKIWFRYEQKFTRAWRECREAKIKTWRQENARDEFENSFRVVYVVFENPQATNKITCNRRTKQATQNDHIHSTRERCYSRLNEANL